jgi:hypothetical protein
MKSKGKRRREGSPSFPSLLFTVCAGPFLTVFKNINNNKKQLVVHNPFFTALPPQPMYNHRALLTEGPFNYPMYVTFWFLSCVSLVDLLLLALQERVVCESNWLHCASSNHQSLKRGGEGFFCLLRALIVLNFLSHLATTGHSYTTMIPALIMGLSFLVSSRTWGSHAYSSIM